MRGEGGSGGVSTNEYRCAHGALISFGDLPPYLTYMLYTSSTVFQHVIYVNSYSIPNLLFSLFFVYSTFPPLLLPLPSPFPPSLCCPSLPTPLLPSSFRSLCCLLPLPSSLRPQSLQSANLSIQSSARECCSPPPLGGRGWGNPIPTMGQTLWYTKYATIPLSLRPSASLLFVLSPPFLSDNSSPFQFYSV
jgi:hypothetical protein